MSFVENGRPNPDGEDEILDELIESAETAFGREFDPNEVSVIRAFYQPVSEYLAGQQEDLSSVLNSAQIQHADGEALDLLAGLIGIQRLQAAAATTRLQFRSDSRVTRDYSLPEGSRGQTDNADPVRYETDYSSSLPLLDDFESGNLDQYGGDTGAFSVQSTTTFSGSNALEASAQTGTITNSNETLENGCRVHGRVYLNSGSEVGLLFGVQNTDSHYSLVLDEPDNEVRVDVTESSSTSNILSGSATLPTGEWLDVQLDWNHNGEYDVTVFDASGGEILSASDSETTPTYQTGFVGFQSLDTSTNKYIDDVTTSRVSVDATAASTGGETNVGTDTVIILASTLNGVDSVTNPVAGSGGRDDEPDDDFRIRAQDELSTALRATLPALINRLDALPETSSITVIDNDTNSTDSDGRPPHSFEPIVDVAADNYDVVGETILDTKAVGDTSVGGHTGSEVTTTLSLSNGQSKDISFSVPTVLDIYVSVSLSKTDTYGGDAQVRDNIVQYIGGTLSSGDDVDGELEVGDDVVYNQIVEAIMDVEGVHDISSLDVDTSSPPSGSSNISVSDNEAAQADATDSSIGVTASDI